MLSSSLRNSSLSARYCEASDLISATADRNSCTCCRNSSTDCARACPVESEGAVWAEAHEQPARTATMKTGTISDCKQNLCRLKSSSRRENFRGASRRAWNHAGRAELACASAADEDSSAAGPPSRERRVAGWGSVM